MNFSSLPGSLAIVTVLTAWTTIAPQLAWAQSPLHLQESLRVKAGPLAGAYRLMRDDLRVDWYFCNLGLLPAAKARPDTTRHYLDLYLQRVSPRNGTIERINDFRRVETARQDSDDSYAATMISLAVTYSRESGDVAWWDANVAKIKWIADRVLLQGQKESGLVPVFIEGGVGYLMDNCEVYRGLTDLSTRLTETNDRDAGKFKDAASRVAEGIKSLYDETTKAFRVADAESEKKFYPYRCCQVFPELFGVPLGSPADTKEIYDNAYNFLNNNGAEWQENWESFENADGSLGGFPWMMLGYAAAIHGDEVKARRQLSKYREAFKLGPPVMYTSIHELGFAMRIEAELAK